MPFMAIKVCPVLYGLDQCMQTEVVVGQDGDMYVVFVYFGT